MRTPPAIRSSSQLMGIGTPASFAKRTLQMTTTATFPYSPSSGITVHSRSRPCVQPTSEHMAWPNRTSLDSAPPHNHDRVIGVPATGCSVRRGIVVRNRLRWTYVVSALGLLLAQPAPAQAAAAAAATPIHVYGAWHCGNDAC